MTGVAVAAALLWLGVLGLLATAALAGDDRFDVFDEEER